MLEESEAMNRLMLAVLLFGSWGLVGTAHAAGDAASGKAKAATCAMCHGPEGQGTSMGPKLAGEEPSKFVAAMNAYKAGKGDNAMMKSQASGLSGTDIANLAAYYASLK
jgi:cytochrome c553